MDISQSINLLRGLSEPVSPFRRGQIGKRRLKAFENRRYTL